MAAERNEHIDEIEEEDQFLDPNDVVVELGEDGDQPMEEDDELGPMEEQGFNPLEDEIVYEDNSAQHFPNHQGSVFCVATHPSTTLAATGGEDDLGYIWDFVSGEEVVKLTGHTDSVTSVAWSSDGEMVSTGGMDGKVRIWRRVGKENWKTWEFLTELQGPDEVTVSSSVFAFF